MGNATIDPWEDEAGGNINVDFEEGEAPQPGGETVLLEETFESSIGKFEIKDVELGTLSYVWKHDATFHYMKASAFVGGAKAAESRLVSPAVEIPNDATNAILTFKHVMGFVLGDEAKDYFTLEVTDNDESSWTPVEIPNYPNEIKSGDWTTEASSGDIDLSAYKGKTIKFAFKYKSTASNAPTWEVYDVKLVANAGSGTVDPDPDPKPEPSEAVYTSNITLPTGTSTDTNKASGGEVNIGSQKYPILKLGTSSAYGSWTTSPITANATSLSFYAVAWNGDTSMLTISIDNGGSFDDDQTSKTIELAGNANLSGNSPFTFTPTDSDYKTFTLKNITASSTITFSTVDGGSDGRAILVRRISHPPARMPARFFGHSKAEPRNRSRNAAALRRKTAASATKRARVAKRRRPLITTTYTTVYETKITVLHGIPAALPDVRTRQAQRDGQCSRSSEQRAGAGSHRDGN